ncbi:GNAT family N-acetyltransferase [Aureimonas mangrovi]|uniref:GNAT family N-acetyltransferase n=1 Tax=Aureimonas mangrovi TaxID=2758041 RepID=UPI00163D9667|nr:N-acetyltransferase [Aureimonas mangrovi]
MMSLPAHLQIEFTLETAAHDEAVEALSAEAFGPGRFTRAAARVREMTPHDRSLSFVAMRGAEFVGSVRQTRVMVGTRPAVMLGPLAVKPAFKGKGAGRALMAMAADAARLAGETAIFLVGDRAYYMPLGYEPLPARSVLMPGPVDERRILGLALVPGALQGLSGAVGPR